MNWTKDKRRAERRRRLKKFKAQGLAAYIENAELRRAHPGRLWSAIVAYRAQRLAKCTPEQYAREMIRDRQSDHRMYRRCMSWGQYPARRGHAGSDWGYHAVSMLRSQVIEDLRMECEWLEETGRGHRRPRLYLGCTRNV